MAGTHPVVAEIEDDPVRLPPADDGVRKESGKRAGEAVHGLLEKLDLVGRQVSRGLGALRQALHGRQGQRNEAEAGGQARRHRREPG
jgi:hypothetical protein